MESKNSDLKYWQVRIHRKFANVVIITCPVMNNSDLSFGVKRGIYKELRRLEGVLPIDTDYWAGYANMNDPHIMKMWAKVDAQPFYIDLKKDRIWFKKRLKNV
ncbi:MAG: hypothetical protein GY774_35745 [Planctomycetes bacterium]|nr:hypothetical protein [Planctomycetota bacterium]